MTELFEEATHDSPQIDFNYTTGILKITGRAYSNDIYQFYKIIDSWFSEYIKSPNDSTTIEIQLEYFNSIFSKLLIQFFEKAKSIVNENRTVQIKWHHEVDDNESIDEANRISKIIGHPIEKVAHKNLY